MAERIGGVANVAVDGVLYKLTGTWTYDLGNPKRTAKKGPDGRLHGYTEEPKPAFIEGAVTDSADLDVSALQNITSATIQLDLANTKTILQRDSFYAGPGTVTTEAGEVAVRFEAEIGEEV